MTAKPRSRPFGPRPLKELGQHFLIDEEIAQRIADAAQLKWEDRAFEIGPGRGILLRFLLKQSQKVTAVEVDYRLQKSLLSAFGGHPGLNLIFEDILTYDLDAYIAEEETPVKLLGNLPYNLSSPLLFKLFETAERLQTSEVNPFQSATLMLQREVAERICTDPGTRAGGGITIFRALVAEAELLFHVPPNAFHPPPKVTSSVLQLRFYNRRKYDIVDQYQFIALVHHVFRSRRKMLKNTVAGLSWLKPDWQQQDFNFTQRPEALSLNEFIRMFDLIRQNS
ncbi:ribosomal RNA small subunit methyltransferase A [bacterium]|nr:ribosomal RNA small subunit methyltransferase A [bacterium]